MVSAVKSDRREAALTILARMIVRAYLGEIDRGEAGPDICREKLSAISSRSVESHEHNPKPSNDYEPEN